MSALAVADDYLRASAASRFGRFTIRLFYSFVVGQSFGDTFTVLILELSCSSWLLIPRQCILGSIMFDAAFHIYIYFLVSLKS